MTAFCLNNLLHEIPSEDVCTYIERLEKANLELSKVNSELIEDNRKLQRKVSEATFLNEVFANLIKSADLEGTINSILNMAVQITRSEVGCIFLHNRKRDGMELMLSKGELPAAVKGYLCDKLKLSVSLSLYSSVVQMTAGDASFACLQAIDPSLRSMLAVPLSVDRKVTGIIILMHRHDGEDEHQIRYSESERKTVVAFARQAALILDNTRLKIEYGRREVYLKTVTALVSAIDAKDAYTRNHSRNVARLSVALGRKLKLSGEELMNLKYGALLHDVGKIGIPEAVLNKKGRLDAQEFDMIKAHPLIGGKILAPIDFLEEALDIVRYHHERFDGTGYPEGLKGENIPFEARIVCIADA